MFYRFLTFLTIFSYLLIDFFGKQQLKKKKKSKEQKIEVADKIIIKKRKYFLVSQVLQMKIIYPLKIQITKKGIEQKI